VRNTELIASEAIATKWFQDVVNNYFFCLAKTLIVPTESRGFQGCSRTKTLIFGWRHDHVSSDQCRSEVLADTT